MSAPTAPGPGACAFLQELAANNNRAWFAANRERYTACVVEPLADLVTALAPHVQRIDPEFEVSPVPGRALSRPFRDMRFARPGTGPLHEAAWLVFGNRRLGESLPPGFFFEVSATGFRYGMGFYSLPRWRMDKIRAAIDRDPRAFRRIAEQARAVPGVAVCGPPYARPMGTHLEESLRTWYARKCIHVEVVGAPEELAALDIAGQVASTYEQWGPLYLFWRDSGLA